MSLATSLRSSSWRTSTNSFRVAHLELHNFPIKSLIALTPGFLLSISNSWMSCLVIPYSWATCFQFFWTGEESESSCRIKSTTSYGKSASLKSNITKEQSLGFLSCLLKCWSYTQRTGIYQLSLIYIPSGMSLVRTQSLPSPWPSWRTVIEWI